MPRPGSIGGLALVVAGLDQATKWWALRALPPGESLPVVPGVLHLTLMRNPGVAFGLFARQGGLVVGVALLLVTILVFSARGRPAAGPRPWGMGLILGGAVGNLVDRLRFGAVTDFLDFRVWPVFNVADSSITIGALLIAWAWWKGR
ncbi:MAG: signal peptidase II [Candidatus Omnitrophica bacterium]|nr:signal peptidase II [Candidatus Omnitrophota bacterium]